MTHTSTPGLADEAARLDPRSDEVLAQRAALGDKAAFSVIFARHGAAVHRYAVRMLDGDHQAAEDAVQEAFTKAWLRMDSFHGKAAFRTWLFRIVSNVCLSARRRRRPISVDDALFDTHANRTFPEPQEQADAEELRQLLDRALQELPWRQRAAWLLREIEDLSYEEIAEALQTTPSVVRGQLHRARATLRMRMAQWR